MNVLLSGVVAVAECGVVYGRKRPQQQTGKRKKKAKEDSRRSAGRDVDRRA
jgi:hypothetical protein